jgi:hypothetical protein
MIEQKVEAFRGVIDTCNNTIAAFERLRDKALVAALAARREMTAMDRAEQEQAKELRTIQKVRAELDALEAQIDRAEMYGDPCPLYPKRKALEAEIAELQGGNDDTSET